MLEIKNLNLSYGKTKILNDICFISEKNGGIVSVIGPNGAGKSTLLKCISNILNINENCIFFDGQDITTIAKDTLAKTISYMPQDTHCNASITVFEAILMARKISNGIKVVTEDINFVSNLLTNLGIDSLSGRYLSDLSGGQRQLVSLAQSLVRSPSILLLDEPTSALDLNHQIESLELIRKIVKNSNILCFIAMHDLSLAGKYSDTILVMNKGKIIDVDSPKKALNKNMLENIYNVEGDIIYKESGTFVIPQKSLTLNENNIDLILNDIYKQASK